MRTYTPQDLEQVNSWRLARGIAPYEARDLPKLGMIEDGVACGFLCLTDCSTCFLDAFVTNKDADPKARNKALMTIARWLLGIAKANNLKQCIVITKEMSMSKRAEDLGFDIYDVFVGNKIL